MINKLALGTVQFGLAYGMNNTDGQVSLNKVHSILNYAHQAGIDTLDTARLYGESEEVLGNSPIKPFQLISKLPPCEPSEVQKQFETSLRLLKKGKLYGYLIHQFHSYIANNGIFDEMQQLQAEEKIEKVGFSLYSPDELKLLLDNDIDFQLVQVPMNLFDQRFNQSLKDLKERGVEIHIRSSFLQGLFFRAIDNIPDHFQSVKGKLQRLNEICQKFEVEKSALCLGFLMLNEYVDKVVIGVDNVQQLQSNVESLENIQRLAPAMEELFELSVEDETIILPTHWKL